MRLDPAAGPSQYGVALKPGTDAQAYANTLSAALGSSLAVTVNTGGTHLVAVVTLVTMLTIVIIIVAGLGVLNTVALQIRERAHDIGVFKAVGMVPLQTLAMIICSVAVTGLLAGRVRCPPGWPCTTAWSRSWRRGELRPPTVTAACTSRGSSSCSPWPAC